MLHNLQNYFEVLSQTDSLHVDCCPVLLLMWVVLSSSSCGSLSCPPPHVGRCPVLLLMWVVVLSSSSCGSLSCPPPHVGHCPVLLLMWVIVLSSSCCLVVKLNGESFKTILMHQVLPIRSSLLRSLAIQTLQG